MAKFKLTHFDFSGSRGEDCRITLALAGIDFEDRRIKFQDWPELKPTTPFGSLPLLEIDGMPPLAQSNAILSYLGREFGLHPEDPWTAARHDAVLIAVEDLRSALAPTGDTKDEAEKKRRREDFVGGYLHHWANHLERLISGPFLEGNALHVADIKVFGILESLISGKIDHVDGSAFEAFPKLRALHQAVTQHPKVSAWRARCS